MPDIAALAPDALEGELDALAELMHACIHAGASVGYILPFAREDATRFWRDGVEPAVRRGGRLVLVIREDGRIRGTVQLDTDTPPNQPHRGEVRKLLVHPEARRRGLARALMAELESRARAAGRSLLTLDTRTGDAAEPLYASLGYVTSGIIPGYCLDPANGSLDATTIMYKVI